MKMNLMDNESTRSFPAIAFRQGHHFEHITNGWYDIDNAGVVFYFLRFIFSGQFHYQWDLNSTLIDKIAMGSLVMFTDHFAMVGSDDDKG